MKIRLTKDELRRARNVVKVFSRISYSSDDFADRYITFLRISLFMRFGFLTKKDFNTMVVALDTFEQYRQEFSELDPHHEFYSMPDILEKLKSDPDYIPR